MKTKLNINSLLNILERQPKAVLWIIAFVYMIALGVIDFYTGFEISFSFFYLGPVALAAWIIGRTSGIILSIASAATWLVANLLAGEELSNPLIPLWNAIMRAGFYIIVVLLVSEIRSLLEHERKLARTDFLTGALNRRAFYDSAAAEMLRARRFHRPLSIIYFDLDNFKSVNDQFGHPEGDDLLQIVVSTLNRNTRAVDTTARLGGDEFVVLLPETDQEALRVVADRLQQALLLEMDKHRWPVTFSIGAVTFDQSPSSVEEMIRLADQAMYRVKTAGKNAIAYTMQGV
jgi:diguanylate cyclase (GGDEF)-like protein